MAAEKCPNCGAELKPGVLGGLCPKCVLDHAVEAAQQTEATGVGAAGEAGNEPQRPQSASPNTQSAIGRRVGRFGDYELLEIIGRGGMGVVYKARQFSLHRTVALKMLEPGIFITSTLSERLRIEAEAAASLNHPNIVTIYEVSEHGGQPFFSMQLVEGHNLNHYISPDGFHLATGGSADTNKRRGSQATAAHLLAKIARAVDHAHQHGVLHRDLKPANILIDQAGEPHLTDFGLAKIIGHARQQKTASGLIYGTLGFLAPEQAGGTGKSVGTSSDIHGLGAILYAMLTGRPPFRAETPVETLRQTTEDEAKSPTTINAAIDRDLETICLKCLEKEPGQRYRSALALAEDLERWLRREPIEARPVRFVGRVWRWCRREPMIAGMATGLFSLVTVVALLTFSLFIHERVTGQKAREANDRHVKALLARIAESGTRGQVRATAEELAAIADFEWQGDVTDNRINLAIQSPERLSERTLEPLGSFIQCLHTSLWTRAKFSVFMDLSIYRRETKLLAGLQSGEADVFRLDPASFVLARRQMPGLIPIARQVYRYKAGLRGAIVTHLNSGITNLAGLKGGSFAFGEEGSAIGWYLPRAALAGEGLKARHFQWFTNLPSPLVINAVRKRSIQAGIVVWEDPEGEPQRLAKGGFQLRILKELECASPIWVALPRLGTNTTAVLQDTFQSLRDEKILTRLDSQMISFVPVRVSDYERLDQEIEQARTFDSP